MDFGYTNVPNSLNDLIIFKYFSYRLCFFLDFGVFSVKFQIIIEKESSNIYSAILSGCKDSMHFF
jgi:hypothetical protein